MFWYRFNLNRTCSIPTTPINAGIGQVLSITPMSGQSFGNTRGSGNIAFINADDPVIKQYVALDPIDWINPNYSPTIWNSNLIQVPLTSIVTIPLSAIEATPGSGFIKVNDDLGNVFTSITPLKVDYAILTYGVIKDRVKLVRNKCKNGLTFSLGTNIGINSPEHLAIDSACKAWSEKLDIDITLSTIQQSPETKYDTYSIISMESAINLIQDPDVNMQTKPWVLTGCGNNVFIIEADIVIRQNPPAGPGWHWHYDVDNYLPTDDKDFYAAILHEIGHALGLLHSYDIANQEKELMHPYTPEGAVGNGTSSGNRTNLDSGGGESAEGELDWVVVPSRNTSVSGCQYLSTLVTKAVSSPTITSSINSFCSNGPITLTSSTHNYSQFGNVISNQWSTSPPQSTQSIVVIPPGHYTLSVTQTNPAASPPNTCTSTATVATLIPSQITTQPSSHFACLGGNTTFSVFAPGFTNDFQWQISVNYGINWQDLNANNYYDGVNSNQLLLLEVINFLGKPQWYRCMVDNGQDYCPVPSDKAELQVTKVELQPFASVLTGSVNQFHITGGTPAGGSYSGTNVTCPAPCIDYIYTPPSNPLTDLINYTVPGCLPANASQQIQVIYCPFTVCDVITTNLNQGFTLCFDFTSTVTFDVPYTILGAIPDNIEANLTDVNNSFNTVIGSVSSPSPNGINHCTLNGPIGPASFRIRIDGKDAAGNLIVFGELSPYDVTVNKNCDQNRLVSSNLMFALYPNPANGNVRVEFINNKNFEKEFSLIDMQGRVCLNKRFDGSIESIVLDISMINAGVYGVVIKTGNAIFQKKLVVTE